MDGVAGAGLWRGAIHAGFCPYCGIRARLIDFLTPGQESYVAQFCSKMREALDAEVDGEHVIDMDGVADAVSQDAVKPSFYYAEENQQNKFACNACGALNDILGRFGYCSVCRTRNDLQELSDKTIPSLRNESTQADLTRLASRMLCRSLIPTSESVLSNYYNTWA